ncbi:metalloregulator ArsR/SmtB family transcription factor [uncultured Porticoccus sp.]|uniref:metalloregulator ArsR/SmtB family transcription factor n=1 Tax=uncultured Porticoccus sp. TaxID=1256050 RepID=UPI0026203FFF|nr:metalloregulator ArsR/SmtB family transcription factor [uncultured Porticoccus sp.]
MMTSLQSATRESTGSDTDSLAALCKAAGDPLRVDILRVLRHNAYGVLELSEILDIGQSGMSHHLKRLTKAGLTATRREGNSIFYRRSPIPDESRLQSLHRALFAAIDQTEPSLKLQQRIQRVNDERTRASSAFFEQNADRFHVNQDLIASFDQYGEPVTDFLDATPGIRGTVLEIGPGEGSFLPALSLRFDQVIALDLSAEMLHRSRELAETRNLANIQFIHGDTGLAVEHSLYPDYITLNMVLHHTPDPALIFKHLAKLLVPGGALIVTELCHHDQSWARESCGDLWLGFEPEDLSSWASAAALTEGESLFLAQRNGFQVQLRQFFKPNPNRK